MSNLFSNAKRRYVQRKRPKRHETAVIQQLVAYRDECKDQGLSTECAMATAMIEVFMFDECIRTQSMGAWLAQLGMMRGKLANLRCALSKEFDTNAEVDNGTR